MRWSLFQRYIGEHATRLWEYLCLNYTRINKKTAVCLSTSNTDFTSSHPIETSKLAWIDTAISNLHLPCLQPGNPCNKSWMNQFSLQKHGACCVTSWSKIEDYICIHGHAVSQRLKSKSMWCLHVVPALPVPGLGIGQSYNIDLACIDYTMSFFFLSNASSRWIDRLHLECAYVCIVIFSSHYYPATLSYATVEQLHSHSAFFFQTNVVNWPNLRKLDEFLRHAWTQSM